jgi:hypothetical protein
LHRVSRRDGSKDSNKHYTRNRKGYGLKSGCCMVLASGLVFFCNIERTFADVV